MTARLNKWTKIEAEANIADVFNDAKLGLVQEVLDNDGRFEVRFIPDQPKESAGRYLARGGPAKDD